MHYMMHQFEVNGALVGTMSEYGEDTVNKECIFVAHADADKVKDFEFHLEIFGRDVVLKDQNNNAYASHAAIEISKEMFDSYFADHTAE